MEEEASELNQIHGIDCHGADLNGYAHQVEVLLSPDHLNIPFGESD